ncbi:hypothetical protein C9374_001644 [Naegleria lovaniensis]|uniref:Myb transcription factor n=1 Tax=Naegleria lovaniensis TaxID=51637 RepID=A0AA88KRG7_NAELO|nr:uncharacterized protein C9374_001644 [Naegleria lovaniensis]KAG2387312.1 hypothetical protein C9374_001644 [Naegleria lovaniensis]
MTIKRKKEETELSSDDDASSSLSSEESSDDEATTELLKRYISSGQRMLDEASKATLFASVPNNTTNAVSSSSSSNSNGLLSLLHENENIIGNGQSQHEPNAPLTPIHHDHLSSELNSDIHNNNNYDVINPSPIVTTNTTINDASTPNDHHVTSVQTPYTNTVVTPMHNFQSTMDNTRMIDEEEDVASSVQSRLFMLKNGLRLNSEYRELIQAELEKIEQAQRNVGDLQRELRTEFLQRQKGPPMSLYPARKNLAQATGKISKKLACEYFVTLAQSKLKAAGSNAIIVDKFNTTLVKSEALASKNSIDKPKKPKKNQKKKKRNTEDEEYISESEFVYSDEENVVDDEMEIDTSIPQEKDNDVTVIEGPKPNDDAIKRHSLIDKTVIVDTRKWTTNEIKNLRYAIRLQSQELKCAFILENYKGNSALIKKEFENISKMPGEELENIETSKIDWEKVAMYHVKTRKPEECRKYWEIELAKDIKKENWTKEEDLKLLRVAEDYKGHDWEKIAEKMYENQELTRRPIHCFRRYQRSLNTNMMRSKWTPEEDDKLMEAVKLFGEKNWQQIANQLDERTGQQCLHRWMKTLNPAIKRGRWTVEEDKRLYLAVHAYPPNNWVLVNRHTPGRTDVQCRERWCNILNPDLKVGPWTKEEDESLKKAIKELGAGNWSKIAEVMYPRTDNQCWRRWRLISSEEVPDYRKKILKREKALVKNFVGREKERPDITADDLEIPHPEEEDDSIGYHIKEFVNDTRTIFFASNRSNNLLSQSICLEALSTLEKSLSIPKLKNILEIEWQRMEQIRYLVEKTPYFIGVPPSNFVKRIFHLLSAYRLPTELNSCHDTQDLPTTHPSSNHLDMTPQQQRISHFKQSIPPVQANTPIFTTPCIIPTNLFPSLPCIPASAVSLNALATLHEILNKQGKSTSQKTTTTVNVEVIDENNQHLESQSILLKSVKMPTFESQIKDAPYDPPVLIHNDPTVLKSNEFKTLTSVFNSLFQRPLQQTMGRIAERLPFLLRRVPNIDTLNDYVEECQTTYQHECQNSTDPILIEKSQWNTDTSLNEPPTFPSLFSLYQHLPNDQFFEKEPATAPATPIVVTKPKGVRGRPKGSKNKKTLERARGEVGNSGSVGGVANANGEASSSSTILNTQQSETSQQQGVVVQKRGRGRPKGSKNKPKTLEQLTEQKKKQLNKPVVRKVSKNSSGSSKKRKTSENITNVDEAEDHEN